MKYNLEHFSEIMEKNMTEDAKKIEQQTDKFFTELTRDLSRDISSPEVQTIVHSLLMLIQENGGAVSLNKPYIHVLIAAYSSDYIRKIIDTKYKEGASDYIVKAFRYYAENHRNHAV